MIHWLHPCWFVSLHFIMCCSVLVRTAVNLSWREDFERTAQFLPQLFFAGVLLRCIFSFSFPSFEPVCRVRARALGRQSFEHRKCCALHIMCEKERKTAQGTHELESQVAVLGRLHNIIFVRCPSNLFYVFRLLIFLLFCSFFCCFFSSLEFRENFQPSNCCVCMGCKIRNPIIIGVASSCNEY